MILFVCSQGDTRSKTAAALCMAVGYEALACGVEEHSSLAIGGDLISRSSAIFCMEESHRRKIQTQFLGGVTPCPVYVLGIRDEYEEVTPALIELLIARTNGVDALVSDALRKGAFAIADGTEVVL